MKNESPGRREVLEEIPVLVWVKNEDRWGSFLWCCYKGLEVRVFQQLAELPGQDFLQLPSLISSSSRTQVGSCLLQVLTWSFANLASLISLFTPIFVTQLLFISAVCAPVVWCTNPYTETSRREEFVCSSWSSTTARDCEKKKCPLLIIEA